MCLICSSVAAAVILFSKKYNYLEYFNTKNRCNASGCKAFVRQWLIFPETVLS